MAMTDEKLKEIVEKMKKATSMAETEELGDELTMHLALNYKSEASLAALRKLAKNGRLTEGTKGMEDFLTCLETFWAVDGFRPEIGNGTIKLEARLFRAEGLEMARLAERDGFTHAAAQIRQRYAEAASLI